MRNSLPEPVDARVGGCAGTEIVDFESAVIRDRLRVTVSPGDPGAPVLYVLDPISLFDLAIGVSTMLRTAARFTGGPFPRLTVVGVGLRDERSR